MKRTPMRRGKGLTSKTRLRAKSTTKGKIEKPGRRWRSPKYLAWVRTQACVVTGSPADEVHHAIGVDLSGMGLTAPDWAVMPVTRNSHRIIHNTPDLWQGQWGWVVLTLSRAVAMGAPDAVEANSEYAAHLARLEALTEGEKT